MERKGAPCCCWQSEARSRGDAVVILLKKSDEEMGD